MSALDNYECEGQMSMFDLYGQDFLYGKTYREPSVPTKEKTLDAYSKKFAELRIKMPQYLCLKKENGVQADASWDQESSEYIQWLGGFQMRSFGEFPKEENESRLSQILQDHPHPKYSLSARACQGILRRAEKRGKELPPLLKQTLLKQSLSKNEQDVKAAAKEYLYNTTESEPCQQSIINQSYNNQVIGFDSYNLTETGEVGRCLSVKNDPEHQPCVIQGSNWDGTQTSPTLTANNAGGAQRMPDKDNFNAVITYGLDRASFNQGKNAQYDFSIEEEKAQTIVAKGPGGVMTNV